MPKFKANMAGEAYLKGRKAGVTGTYGEKKMAINSRKGGVEQTVVAKNDMHDSGAEDGLPAAARSMYKNSLKNGGGRDGDIGDKALRDR